MQTTVAIDLSGRVAKEMVGRISKYGAGVPVSKVYIERVNHLYNYGMNACDDRVLVKNCIVQCFLLAGPGPESTKDTSFSIDIFKVFRRLLIEKIGKNLFPAETEGTRELTSLQHEALFLKFQRKLSYREIADIMDLPIEHLRSHVSKAVGILLREK